MPPPLSFLLYHVLPRLSREDVIFIGEKKMGRPLKADEPKTVSLHLRISESESRRIKKCSEQLGKPRTDTIMAGIELLEEQIGKNQ